MAKKKKSKSKTPTARSEQAVKRLLDLKIEVPSWGFANTGTRFGKYLQPAAAVDLEDKLADAGTVHKYTGTTPTVAVHVLWDFPKGFDSNVIKMAESFGVQIGSINPNLFQDQCYKHGSVTNRDAKVRRKAVKHIQDSIEIGRKTKSQFLSLWFADGANYPGGADIRQRKKWATKSLQKALDDMPKRMTALIEYKPFEPAAYFTDFFDWGSSYIFAKAAGKQAKVLVDTGHHLLGTNIEQIVAWLLDEKMLGGFHFNDRKFADDDLTVGSIDPYQAFRIFNEIAAYEHDTGKTVDLAWMIDQSHNIKPKIQATIQTVCTVQQLFAKAMLVDRSALATAQANEDTVAAEEILRAAYHADVTDILTAARKKLGAPADPLGAFRDSGHEAKLAEQRTQKRKDLGIEEGGSYA